jgi:hypothetical protein
VQRILIAIALISVGAAGCDKDDTAAVGPNDPRTCSSDVRAVPDEGATHVPFNTPVTYESNPPASGSHWPSPATWGVYVDPPIPREQYVHNLEHGGIVLAWNCPGAGTWDMGGGSDDAGSSGDGGTYTNPCPEISAALKELREELKPDKWGVIRVLVTRDPLLPPGVKVAAIAWDWLWTGDTVDKTVLRCFRDARYGKGPEDAP